MFWTISDYDDNAKNSTNKRGNKSRVVKRGHVIFTYQIIMPVTYTCYYGRSMAILPGTHCFLLFLCSFLLDWFQCDFCRIFPPQWRKSISLQKKKKLGAESWYITCSGTYKQINIYCKWFFRIFFTFSSVLLQINFDRIMMRHLTVKRGTTRVVKFFY